MSNAVAIRPITITDAILFSTDATETVAEWSDATTYNTGDRARSDTTHRIYEAAEDAVLDVDPTDPENIIPAEGAKWIEVGPTNAWAMFDLINGTVTTREDSLEVVLTPPRIDSLGLQGLLGATVQVVVNDGSSDIYDETFQLTSSEGIVDWFSWFFEERQQRTSLLLTDLPAIEAPEVTVTLSGTGSDVQVGTLSIGRQLDIGSTELGMNLGFRDYGSFEQDEFGTYIVVQRGFSRRADLRLMLPNNRVDQVYRELTALRSTPLFWGLAEGFDSANFFGFFKRLDIEIAYPNQSLVTLQIEGTTE